MFDLIYNLLLSCSPCCSHYFNKKFEKHYFFFGKTLLHKIGSNNIYKTRIKKTFFIKVVMSSNSIIATITLILLFFNIPKRPLTKPAQSVVIVMDIQPIERWLPTICVTFLCKDPIVEVIHSVLSYSVS